MPLTNLFFLLARNPVHAIIRRSAWAAWEIECFRLLHPAFPAALAPDGLPHISTLPGHSLASLLDAGTLAPAHMTAAAAELRRAHALHSAWFDGPWSHGDPHTGNFVFDPATGTARLIDFELRHHRRLPADARHADDLLVLLQDVCGRCTADAWLPLATALTGTASPRVTALLREKLRVPRGIPRLWWGVRTTWLPRAELERRITALRDTLPR